MMEPNVIYLVVAARAATERNAAHCTSGDCGKCAMCDLRQRLAPFADDNEPDPAAFDHDFVCPGCGETGQSSIRDMMDSGTPICGVESTPTCGDMELASDREDEPCAIAAAINQLSRAKIQSLLENQCGTAVFDDEPMKDLRECLAQAVGDTVSFEDLTP